jgi:hypothetical protein
MVAEADLSAFENGGQGLPEDGFVVLEKHLRADDTVVRGCDCGACVRAFPICGGSGLRRLSSGVRT